MQKRIKFEGRELVFDLPTEADQSVFEEIFRDREYRELEDILRKAEVVLDLGAHKGIFSVYASVLGVEQIYTFEPDVDNFAAMKEHLKMNGVKNVLAKNVAVAGVSGERELYLSEDSHNHSLIGGGDAVKVRATTVTDILRKFRIESVDLLKMDIEGAEFEVLQAMGAEDFSRIDNLFVEYHELSSEVKVSQLREILKFHQYAVVQRVSVYDKRMGYLIARSA